MENIFNQFSQKRVLIVGDAMIDSYLYGKVDRISPEAPIPIVSVTEEEDRLGGAGNVARNILSLGATPILFSVVGNDTYGELFNRLLEKRGMTTDGIISSQYRKTTVKTRVISAGQHIVRVDNETVQQVSEDVETELINRIRKTVAEQKIDIIIFVDYDKGVLSTNVITKLKALADDYHIMTAVDPKRKNFLTYKGVDLFKPNFKEFNEGLGIHVPKGDIEGLRTSSKVLHSVNRHRNVFVTLSELGVFYSSNVEHSHIPAEIRYIADVSGAGDTVISVASLALAAGMSSEQIAVISNLAGGLVCEQVGVVPIDKELLKQELLDYYKN
ncbi:D-glycero-beta-D-manno-heptose-7-phosphate kinase [Prolixibacteraceae bacterium JC049]|nr:D-glycero-beta-D-manno-heptose-7-phosphate kinase [Prolixibacteraceae bacterium JC049]